VLRFMPQGNGFQPRDDSKHHVSIRMHFAIRTFCLVKTLLGLGTKSYKDASNENM